MIPAVMPTYARFDLTFEKGEGVYLYATNGRRYLDFTSGIAVTALGHCHPHLVKTLQDQAGKLWHCSNLFHIPDQERLARRLVENSFADTVFFANSGVEANECALKLVRKHHDDAGHPERYRVITVTGAFHGRSLATLAAGGNPKYLKGYDPVVDGFDQVPFGNLNVLRDKITPQTAAILIEPVQGEGGLQAASAEYLRGLRQTADEFGLLLVFDEVQCGMGRTGHLFAYEQAGVAPDIMTLAKGLGGGFPIGACLATEKAAAGISPGAHGTTFGGNPLAMAVGNAVLDVMLDSGFLARVQEMAAQLRHRLEALIARHPTVLSEVRGRGLLTGVKCVVLNTDVIAVAQKNGLLTVGAGDNVMRLLPPLIVESAHIDEALDILERTCSELAA